MAASDPFDPEAVRKRYLYRRLILTGRVRLPRSAATRLIGPDCAYHLYGAVAGTSDTDHAAGGADLSGEERSERGRTGEERDA